MGNVRTHIMLSAELLKQLDETVGKGRRSEFIEEAVERALRQRRLRQAIRAIAEGDDLPVIPEWEGDIDAWIREGRRDRRDEWADSSETSE